MRNIDVTMYGRTPSEAVEKAVKNIKKKHTESLYRDFLDAYSYIGVSIDVVRSFVELGVKTRDRENELDLLRDYVLSQNLEDDVVE